MLIIIFMYDQVLKKISIEPGFQNYIIFFLNKLIIIPILQCIEGFF